MISFLNENIKMPKLDRKAVRAWIAAVAAGYDGRKVGNLNYILYKFSKNSQNVVPK